MDPDKLYQLSYTVGRDQRGSGLRGFQGLGFRLRKFRDSFSGIKILGFGVPYFKTFFLKELL